MITVILCKYMLVGTDRPSLRHLYNHVVPAVADKWRDLGVHLLDPSLIDQRVLEVIAADHPHSVEDCCKKMFEKWLTTQLNPSWSQLIEALKLTDLCYVASHIEGHLQGMYTFIEGYHLFTYITFLCVLYPMGKHYP